MYCPECGHRNKDGSSFCQRCGHSLLGTLQDGRYEILDILGEGGMGKVFKVRDTKMESDIVIKQLLPPRDDNPKTLKYLENRFFSEAKLLYRLNFKGLPKVMDIFTESNSMFISMQYIDGNDLSEILKEQPSGRIDLVRAMGWLYDLLEVLSFLHKQDPPIIHRDIKPKNIMLDKYNNLYLVDFGIARTIGLKDEPKTRVGSFGYASPEHFTGKFDISSDIYSLGATFHHLITGIGPKDRSHPDSFPPFAESIPDFPPALQKIFDKMLAFNKNDRYSSCEEIIEDLQKDDEVTGILDKVEAEAAKAMPIPEIPNMKDKKAERISKLLKTGTKDNTGSASGSSTLPPEEEAKWASGQDKTGKPLVKDLHMQVEGVPVMDQEEKGDKNSLPVVIFVTILLLLVVGYVLPVYVLKIPLPWEHLGSKQNVEYVIKAYSKSEQSMMQLEQLATTNELQIKREKVQLYVKKERGYKAETDDLKSKDAAIGLKAALEKYGFKASINEEDDKVFVQVSGTFSTKNEATRMARKAFKKIDLAEFKAKVNYDRYPYTTNELTVTGFKDYDQAQKLRDQFKQLSEKVEIEEIKKEKESGS